MKITVVGDGAWGTALAINLVANKHDVTVWGAFPDYLDEMRKTGENTKFLKGIKLPPELKFDGDMASAVKDSELILLATPTQFLRSVLKNLAGCISGDPLVVNVAKGIEMDSWLRISEIVAEVLGKVRFVALSGPSHAEEVALHRPTLVVAASENENDAKTVQQAFMNESFRVYTCDDVIGVELGGALKNVMAIAAGIIDGMGLGDNAKAALMARGICEMGRLGEAIGGKHQTFYGLSGIGDLIVTCSSQHSRNRFVGDALGRGKKLKEILAGMGMVVAEGVWTSRGACVLAERFAVETPIISEIYRILFEDRDVSEALYTLMTRAAKSER